MERQTSKSHSFVAWRPKRSASAVQIGERLTCRHPGEALDDLLVRAIAEYPDKGTKLVLVGWHP